MNQQIKRIGLEAKFGMMNSQLWLGQIDQFGLAVVEDCCRELEANGYDDASACIKQYFEIQNNKERSTNEN
jgi:hypothetical protein